MTTQSKQPIANCRKSRLRGLRLLVVAICVLVLVTVLALRFSPDTGMEFHVKAIREAGLPANLEELDRWLPTVPASNNAALLIMEAAEKRVAASQELDDQLPTFSPSIEQTELAEELASYIEKNTEALDFVRRAVTLPTARYRLSATNFNAQHLSLVKSMGNLLKAEAVYHSHRGSTNLAFASITNGFALARTLRHEPAFISELVRIAMVGIAENNLELLLAAQKLSEDQLAATAQILALAEADATHGLFHALVTERAIILHYFNLPSEQFLKMFDAGIDGNFKDKLKMAAYRLFNIRGRDQALFLDVMHNLSSAATNKFPDALRLADEVDVEINRRLNEGWASWRWPARCSIQCIRSWRKRLLQSHASAVLAPRSQLNDTASHTVGISRSLLMN